VSNGGKKFLDKEIGLNPFCLSIEIRDESMPEDREGKFAYMFDGGSISSTHYSERFCTENEVL